MILLAEISNAMFIGCMAVFSALAWLFGWVLGRARDPGMERRWKVELADREQTIAAKDAALADIRGNLDDQRRQLLALKGDLGRREGEVRELTESRAALVGELDNWKVKAERHGAALSELEKEHAELRRRSAETEERIEPLREEIETLRPFQSRVAELEPLRDEVAGLNAKVSELEPFEAKWREAEERFGRQEKEHGAIVSAKDNELHDVRGEVMKRDSRIKELEPLRAEIDKRDRRIKELEPLRGEVDKRDRRIKELEPLRGEIEKRDRRIKELEPLRAEVNKRDQRIAALTPFEAKYRTSEERRTALERQIEPLQAKNRELGERVTALSPYERKYKEAQERLEALERKHREVLRAKDQEIEKLRGKVAELSPLPARVMERDRRIRALEMIEQEHRGCSDEIARLRRRLQEQRPMMPRAETAVRRDDLKKIHGIGRVFERQLNNMGYYTFRDIAAWGPQQVQQVADAIGSFPDRIERDRWIDQAREFSNNA